MIHFYKIINIISINNYFVNIIFIMFKEVFILLTKISDQLFILILEILFIFLNVMLTSLFLLL